MTMIEAIEKDISTIKDYISDTLYNISLLQNEYNEIQILKDNKDINILKQLMKEKIFLSLSDVDIDSDNIQKNIDEEL